MTTYVIILAGAGVLLALGFGGILLARRGGEARGRLEKELDQTRAEAAASQAVAEELAKDRPVDDILKEWGRG